jgi:hypothetical protein
MSFEERQPTDQEIETVLRAFDALQVYIHPDNGMIEAQGWRDVHITLLSLSDYELWLGLCNMASVWFDLEEANSPVQNTLYELFRIAYEEGLEALA